MIDKETIIKEAESIHGDKYIYDNVTDVNNVNGKLHIICPIHGDFYPTYWNHVHFKKGCKKCGFLRNIEARKLTNENFIQKSKLTHTDIENYDFSVLNIDNRDDKGRITIKCKKHGNFKIRPSHFIDGQICPYCKGYYKNDDDVRNELSKIHPRLDFSITKYSEHDDKYRIKVICPTHGIRNLSYYNLRNGQGCDICNQSHLEEEIRLFLIENNFEFEQQKTFEWLKYKYKLRLDFYLPKFNIAIECQGRQHYEAVDFFGGQNGFQSTIHRDNLKYKLCNKHGINIIYFTNCDFEYDHKTVTLLKDLKEAIVS